MKRIYIFIGLKLAEISAVVFIPYYFGGFCLIFNAALVNKIPCFDYYRVFEIWLVGAICLLIVLLWVVIVFELIPAIIKDNWKRAGRMTGGE